MKRDTPRARKRQSTGGASGNSRRSSTQLFRTPGPAHGLLNTSVFMQPVGEKKEEGGWREGPEAGQAGNHLFTTSHCVPSFRDPVQS